MTGYYVFTKLFTFPGTLLHAFVEHIVCRICHIPVEDNRYLRTNEMCGHVEHELACTPRSAFALCYVPMFFNLLIACIVGIFPFIRLFMFGEFTMPLGILDIVCIWLAFSMLVNVSPIKEDAFKMWSLVYSKQSNFVQKIFYFPGAIVIYVWTTLEMYGISFILWLIPPVLSLFIA